MCTDGLYNFVEPEEMRQILQQTEMLEEAVQRLLDLALERDASDNLTVILYRHEKNDPEIKG